jgi:aspartate/methionine/tyrosine aminotransferase
MELPPFLLDHWLSAYDFAQPPIAFNLASSTGPRWSVDELAALGTRRAEIGATVLSYAPPEGAPDLREQVADFQGVDPESVIMTTGSSEALSILLCLQARLGGNVVIPDPGYPAYAAMAQAWALDVRPYRLKPEYGFAQLAETALAATDGDTVAVIVNTPHNPTGAVMERSEIDLLAQTLGSRGIPLIVDEVYHPLYFGIAPKSAAGIDNVLVISDLSKAFSLPGLRTGWIVDLDAARRRRIVDARSYFTISSSPLLETLATHALRQRSDILGRLDRVAGANLANLDSSMSETGDMISWVRPRGGTTCFPWFTDGRDSRPFCEALAKDGVLVAPGDCFGHSSYFRIGFAQQADRFHIASQTIRDLIATMRRPRKL